MAVTFQKKAGTAVITAEKNKKEVINDVVLQGECTASAPMAHVGVALGCTVNLGDFNNVKIHVSLYVPCQYSLPSINETFESVHKWVEDKLEEVHTKMLKD